METAPDQDDDRRIALAVADGAAGRRPDHIGRHFDAAETKSIDLVRFDGEPFGDGAVHATLGLSRHQIGAPPAPGSLDLRLELIGACRRRYDFANILASAAFDVMDGAPISPQQVFTGTVALYHPDFDMKHLLFVYPFMWPGHFEKLELPGRVVTWLQPVPISQRELEFAQANGVDDLTDMFREQSVDVTDLERASVL